MQAMLNVHKVYQIHIENNNMTWHNCDTYDTIMTRMTQFLYDTIVLLLPVTPDIPIEVVGNDTLQRLPGNTFPLFSSKHKVPLLRISTRSAVFPQLGESKLQNTNHW